MQLFSKVHKLVDHKIVNFALKTPQHTYIHLLNKSSISKNIAKEFAFIEGNSSIQIDSNKSHARVKGEKGVTFAFHVSHSTFSTTSPRGIFILLIHK